MKGTHPPQKKRTFFKEKGLKNNNLFKVCIHTYIHKTFSEANRIFHHILKKLHFYNFRYISNSDSHPYKYFKSISYYN